MRTASAKVCLVHKGHKHASRDVSPLVPAARPAGLVLFVLALLLYGWTTITAIRIVAAVGFVIGLTIAAVCRRHMLPRPRRTRLLTQCAAPKLLRGKHRLVCVGDQPELDRVAVLNGQYFEPVIIRALPAHPTQLEGLILVCVVLAGLFTVLFKTPHVIVLAAMCAADGFVCSTALWKPTYCRVCPGRFEVLSYPPFRVLGTPRRKEISLRDSGVLCDFAKGFIHIEPGWTERGDAADAAAPIGWCVDLAFVTEPHALGEALLRAAMCEKDAPRLRDGALVG
ncbi:MAG: hypothetical protein ACE5FI_15635 [Anaerolineales bacterium]